MMTLPFMLVFSHLSPLTSHLLPLTSYLITSSPFRLSKLPSHEVKRAKYCTIGGGLCNAGRFFVENICTYGFIFVSLQPILN